MEKRDLHKKVAGLPDEHVPGLQDDWWTDISPDLWRSHGSFLVDISGEEYLDFFGFLSTAPVSYNHPRLRDKSFLDRLAKASFYRPSLADFWTEELAEFIDSLRKYGTPEYLHHYFLIDGGALAVENALKAAFDWKVRRNIEKGLITSDPVEEKQPFGTKVISFESAFHGRSGYTLSLTHTNDQRKYKYFPKFDWYRVEPPVMFFKNDGAVANPQEVAEKEKKSIEEISSILEKNGDDVAAIIIEPVQCEGGDRHMPTSFFVNLRRLCDEHDVLLIYDEVQTGFGTTGKMWGHEHFGFDAKPDMIAFSKKSQVGGVMANHDKFARFDSNVFSNNDGGKSRLNSTWGGHPTDMLRGAEFLKIINEENLLDNAGKMGQKLLEGIRNLCTKYSTIIENPRGKGMLLGFDMVDPEKQSELWSAMKQEKLLGLTCGTRTIRFRPHLDLTESDVSLGLERLEKALKKLA